MPNNVTKAKGQIEVYGTKEGKLYIQVEDLFNQNKVKTLIEKVVNSEVIKKVKSLSH